MYVWILVCTAVTRHEAEPGAGRPSIDSIRGHRGRAERGGGRGHEVRTNDARWHIQTDVDRRYNLWPGDAQTRKKKRQRSTLVLSAALRQTGGVAAVRAHDHAITEKNKNSCGKQTKARKCKTDWTLTLRAFFPAACAFHKGPCLRVCARACAHIYRVVQAKPVAATCEAKCSALAGVEWELSRNRRLTLCSRQWVSPWRKETGFNHPPEG